MINLEKIYNNSFYKYIVDNIKITMGSGVDLEKIDKELVNKLFEYFQTYLKKTKPHVRRLIEKELRYNGISIYITNDRPLSGYSIITWNPLTIEYKIYIIIPANDLKITSDDLDVILKIYKNTIEKFFISHIADIVYSVYQNIIRCRLIINFSKLKVDYELLKIVSHILTSVVIKIFGKKHMSTIEEDKIKLINLFVSYILLTSYLKYNYNDAIKTVINIYSSTKNYSDIIDKFKELTKNIPMKQFTNINELGRLLNIAQLLDITSVKFLYTLMNTIGTRQLVDLFSSYPGLISSLIVVKYPIDYLNKVLLVGDLNQKLEDYVIKKYA